MIFLLIFSLNFGLRECSPFIRFFVFRVKEKASFFRRSDILYGSMRRQLMDLNFTSWVDSVCLLLVADENKMAFSHLCEDKVFSLVFQSIFHFLKAIQQLQRILVVIRWWIIIDQVKLKGVFIWKVYSFIEFVADTGTGLRRFLPIKFTHLRGQNFFKQGQSFIHGLCTSLFAQVQV